MKNVTLLSLMLFHISEFNNSRNALLTFTKFVVVVAVVAAFVFALMHDMHLYIRNSGSRVHNVGYSVITIYSTCNATSFVLLH